MDILTTQIINIYMQISGLIKQLNHDKGYSSIDITEHLEIVLTELYTSFELLIDLQEKQPYN
jgi:hypothetical protein